MDAPKPRAYGEIVASLRALLGCLLVCAACTNDFERLLEGLDTASASSSGAGGATSSGGGSSSVGSAGAATTGGSASTSSSSSATTGAGGGQLPCGDGDLDPSEQCDDANSANDDGCSGCVLAARGDSAGCLRIPLQLSPPGIWLVGSTTPAATGGYDTECEGWEAGDSVFEVVAPQGGNLRASLVGTFNGDMILAVRAECLFNVSDPSSSTEVCTFGPPELTVPAAANPALAMAPGTSVYVVVSGRDGAEGDFTLHIALGP